ncbi:hypothetical protein [Limnospira sp.]|uniref:hypothetical protein n=1 Tax=Limnospira sp. TaxID=3100384 RepID=UPI003F71471B
MGRWVHQYRARVQNWLVFPSPERRAGAELAGFPVPSKKGGCRIGWFSRPLKEGRVQVVGWFSRGGSSTRPY